MPLATVKEVSEITPGNSLWEEMGGNGDTKHTWDPKDANDVDAAKALFATLKAKGHAVFSMKKMGGKGEELSDFDPNLGRFVAVPMKDFDPSAKRVVSVPPVTGG